MTLDVSSVRAVLDGSARWCSLVGDVRERLRDVPDGCVQTCVTSPPYYLQRDYGVDAQIGLERTPAKFVTELVGVFRDVRRALADDGTLWLNLGDSYASGEIGRSDYANATAVSVERASVHGARRHFTPDTGLPDGSLLGIPWMVAFALRDDGWILRAAIVWEKPAPQPENVTDRPMRAHEMVFLLVKRRRYFCEGMRNVPNVWRIAPSPVDGCHMATMPPELARRCILAGSRKGDVVLDPFFGAATTGLVALQHGRRAIGCELNPDYVALQRERLAVFGADAVSALTVNAPSWGPLFGGAR